MYQIRYFVSALFLLINLGLTTALANERTAPSIQLPVAERALCKHVNAESFVRTELFFGLSRAGAPDISEQEFQNFVDAQVTPRFPDGLTVLSGKGQFRNSAGIIIQEGSKLLILLYPFNKQSSAAVDQIRADYKNRLIRKSSG